MTYHISRLHIISIFDTQLLIRPDKTHAETNQRHHIGDKIRVSGECI